MSFAFLTIVAVSVDYGFVQVAFQPLIGEAYTATSAALETRAVLALQAALIIWSTRSRRGSTTPRSRPRSSGSSGSPCC
jgi:hypothetical protein